MAASSNSPDLDAVGASSTGEAKPSAGPSGAAPSPRPTPASTPETPASAPRRGRWVVWLLALALVLAVLWGLSQGQRVEQLTAEVTRLETELAEVGADLQAHRVHLDRIRADVDDLSERALALRELAHLEPGAESPSGAVRPDSAEPDASAAAEGERAAEAVPEGGAEKPDEGAQTSDDDAFLPRGAIL